jgi:amino acid synthesis protein
MTIRKTVLIREVINTDETGAVCEPITRVVAMAVIANPFAGDFGADLTPLFDLGGQLGDQLVAEAVAQLGRAPVSYGKAAIVGTGGSVEHGAAMIHPKLGKPMRAAIGGGKAVIPSNVKVAAPGTSLDLPLGHKDEAWSFAHFDTMTVMVADAPLAGEIVLCVAVSDGPRSHPRVGDGPITD